MLTSSHQKQIKHIISTLKFSGRYGAIILVACSGKKIQTEVEDRIRQALNGEFSFTPIFLTEEDNNLPLMFRDHPVDGSICLIYNLPEVVRIQESRQPEIVAPCLQYLNLDREVFFERHVPAVFWLDEETLSQKIPWQATDFWNYRTTTAIFEAEEDQIAEIQRKVKGYDLAEKNLARIAREKKGLLDEYRRKRPDDKPSIGAVLTDLGNALYSGGKLEEALKYHQETLEIYQELGYRQGEAIALGNIGLIYQDWGQPQKALKYHQEALGIARELGYRQGEATALGNIGLIYKDWGQPQEALKYHQEALEIDRELKLRQGEAGQLGNIGLIYQDLGQPQEALKYHQEALEIARELGYRQGEADQLGNIGLIYRNLGQPEKALKYLQEALEIARELGYRQGEADQLGNIGLIYRDLGRPEKALKYHQEDMEIVSRATTIPPPKKMGLGPSQFHHPWPL